jgi:hypothetical protein
LSGEAEVPPAGDLSGEAEVPPAGVEVPAGVSVGEVVPAGVSEGVLVPPPASLLAGWQPDRAVTTPTRSKTISFDLTVNILTIYNLLNLGFFLSLQEK